MQYLACTSWNENTQSCDAQAWLHVPTVIPPLSAEQGALIGGAIVSVWAIAYGLRLVARFIWRG